MEEFPPKAANSILEQPAANLESDVSVILRQLKSIGLTNDNYEVDLAKTKAQIFILAAQIYQHGDTALANKLAAQLLVRFPDKKELFTAAVSFLAREAYNQATDAVLKSGDWKEYAARLDYFLKNTPEEWWSRDGVQRLLTAVQRRVDGVQNPLKMPPGHAPDARTVAALDTLLEIKRNTYKEYPRHQELLWILPKAAVLRKLGVNEYTFFRAVNCGRFLVAGSSGIDAILEEIFDSLTVSRMAAIPTLVAATADDTPICLPQGNSGNAWANTYLVAHEIGEDEFSNLYRPATRAEISSGILRILLFEISTKSVLPRKIGAIAMRF